MIVKKKLINIENYILSIYLYDNNGIYSFKSELVLDNRIICSAKTQGITDEYIKADKIFQILAEGCVFPAHLFNVIDEI